MKRISKDWLFRDHTQSEVYKWISTLKYFHFFSAVGGHANDGDYFELRIKFNQSKDQSIFLNALDLPEKKIVEHQKLVFNPPFDKFHCTISQLGLQITVVGTGGNPYKINDIEYDLCIKFEKLIDSIGFSEKVLFDHKTMATCVTLEDYIDYFP